MPHVLVIDDDDAVRSAITLILEVDGYKVTAASDGRAGVAAAANADIQLVLVDIFMPGMDGIETIRALRAAKPNLPIIAMSGAMSGDKDGSPDFLSFATKFGAITSLHKPFRPNELLQTAKKAIGAGPSSG